MKLDKNVGEVAGAVVGTGIVEVGWTGSSNDGVGTGFGEVGWTGDSNDGVVIGRYILIDVSIFVGEVG